MKSEQIAQSLLEGAFEREPMLERIGARIYGAGFTRKLVGRILEHFGSGSRPSVRVLQQWLDQDKKFIRKQRKGIVVTEGDFTCSPQMAPDMRAAADWSIPSITNLSCLAAWLDVSPSHVDWYAGSYGRVSVSSKLSHYRLAEIPKRSGGVRLLEMPKWQMKMIQRHILHGMLDHIPAHPSSHGFQQGRSILTYVAPHVGRELVLKFDLKDYFLNVHNSRVRGLFHLAGYPPMVAKALAGICTHSLLKNEIPCQVNSRLKFTDRHLPQGAPTSPALADRLLFRLDMRLHGLAEKLHLRYTRYADDLAFSTQDTHLRTGPLLRLILQIVAEEGFSLNEKKTRLMPKSQRQRLAGLVINEKTNLQRSEYDNLRAILHRCRHNGIANENRKGHPAFLEHLQGRIAFVQSTHKKRGEKLTKMLDFVSQPAQSRG